MTPSSSRCPDPEVIAAFVAGSLSGPELTMTAEHLRTCDDCREIAAEAARVDREGVVAVARRRQSRLPWWLAAAAAALAGLALLTFDSIVPSRRTDRGISRLVEAAPRDTRYVEPRLSGGFAWAPLHSALRGGEASKDPARMKLIGVAGSVLQDVGSDTAPPARHAAAVAHLLAGDAKEAESVLSAAVTSGGDARMWSDLAAMRYTAALQTGDSARLTEALAAADAALRIDPAFPEALFNRALIIEHLGLREQARAAWRRYLAVDAGSRWAEEARQHLRGLEPVSEFRDDLQRRYALLQTDPEAARALARRHPQDARVWGETEILGRWAEALTRDDEAAAELHLQVARSFAEVLTSRGEHMLASAIEAIERANPPARRTLAAAHLQFREAQRTFRQGHPAAAERLFIESGAAFDAAGSPVALLATYFGANTAYEQGRVVEARATLERLWASAPADYPAHRAQVGWSLGLSRASTGLWGEAIRALDDSVSTFERLDEVGNASFVRDIIAEIYDRLGERRIAWTHRIVALRSLGRTDPVRVRAALDAAARGASVNRDWAVAVSLLGLQLETLERSDDELLRAETLLERARLEARLGTHAAAAVDLERAAAAIARINDPSHRERAEADRLAVEAQLVSTPAAAVPLLSRAIDFHGTKGRRMFLPELLLQRGRAFEAAGRIVEAAADYEAGIREIETQRRSVSGVDSGFGTFTVAGELFDQAVALAMRRGNEDAAFAYVERSRAEPRGSADSSPAGEVGEGEVIIEYATLADRVMIFVVGRNGVHAVERRVARDELASVAEQVSRAAMTNDRRRFRSAAARLYTTLVQPVAGDLESARHVTFVPDAVLDGVPFGALLDPKGRYVLERHVVSTAPSTAWVRRAGRTKQETITPRLLLVQGPQARDRDAETLSYARREVDDVTAAYAGTAEIFPRGGGNSDFQAIAARADVIHFVGHAEIPDGSAAAALVTSRGDGASSRLTAREIAAMRLPRTRIVVLAACGTARGRQQPGDTSISVARAFLTAGVTSVVATLWPIDDALAAEFFPRLHVHLAQGRAPAEALRATQLEWLHRPDAPPAMWAAVQIIGR